MSTAKDGIDAPHRGAGDDDWIVLRAMLKGTIEFLPDALDRIADPETRETYEQRITSAKDSLLQARKDGKLDLAVIHGMDFERWVMLLLKDAYHEEDERLHAQYARLIANKARTRRSDDEVYRVLEKVKGNMTLAADLLGYAKSALYKRVDERALAAIRKRKKKTSTP